MKCSQAYENGVFIEVIVLTNEKILEDINVLLDSFKPDKVREVVESIEKGELITLVKVFIKGEKKTLIDNALVIANINTKDAIDAIIEHKMFSPFEDITNCLARSFYVI